MGFFDRLANAWYIFTKSLSFIGRDKSLLVIPFLLIFSVIIFCILFFFLFPISFLLASKTGVAINVSISIIANFLIFILFIYVWTTFLGAAQSWMVHEVAQGKNTKVLSGLKRAIKNILDILLFSLVELLITILISSLRRKGGLLRAAGGFIGLITGIAGKLVLPAMIVTERNFIESVKQLGKAIKIIPEIATFEIGIRPLTSLITWISLGIAFLFGFAFGFPTGIIIFIILISIVIMFSILINQIYYTLLYLTMIEKKKVPGLKLSR